MPPRGASSGGQNPEFVLQHFKGMNNIDARELIEDDEFYWCENAIPIGSGTLYPTAQALALMSIATENNAPTYEMTFTAGSANYTFVVFANTGHGYVVQLSFPFTATQIMTGLTSQQTFATQYSNSGILIIDPTGYWDYSVTTPNVLTPWNNTAAFATLTGVAGTIAGNTNLKLAITAAGTGATFQATYSMTSATLSAGGAGYAVGDVIYLTDNNPTAPAQIIVASTGGGGAVATFTIASGGAYPGPTTTGFVLVGPSGTVSSTTGAGTGATFSTHIQATAMKILTPGHGYTGTTTVNDVFGGGPTTLDSWNITSSGVIGGTSIATYAGRVWIASGRVVIFTDINSYNGFGGAGGSFTINDGYLTGNITALFSANNYLYIFGPTSIDALSNVTITLGVTAFSRINLTASVGTIQQSSIFSYYRSIVFFNVSGIYQLSGATPEKISGKISGVIRRYQFGTTVYGFAVYLMGELCAAMQFAFTDVFVTGTVREIIVLYFRGRWWVSSYTPGFALSPAIDSIAVGDVMVAYGFRANIGTGVSLYQLFGGATLNNWTLKTRLWDAGAPLREKQSLNAAIAGVFTGAAGTGVNCTIDTEKVSSAPLTLIPNGEPTGYNLNPIAANQGGSQFLGMTITGGVEMSQIDLIALKGKTDRDMLA